MNATPFAGIGDNSRPETPMPHRLSARRRNQLVLAAAVWSCVLLVLALTVPFVTRQPAPAYGSVPGTAQLPGAAMSTHLTLVQTDGYRILILVAIPLLASVLVGFLLRRSAATGSGSTVVAARALASLVLVGAVAGFLTFLIGIAAVPTGALLLAATL